MVAFGVGVGFPDGVAVGLAAGVAVSFATGDGVVRGLARGPGLIGRTGSNN